LREEKKSVCLRKLEEQSPVYKACDKKLSKRLKKMKQKTPKKIAKLEKKNFRNNG